MALGCPFAVMAILVAETLITLGASPNPGLSTWLVGAGEKGLGELWESVGGYGSGFGEVADATLLPTQ